MVSVLKQAEVGVPVVEVCRKVGITECLDTHWFTTLAEAKQIIEA